MSFNYFWEKLKQIQQNLTKVWLTDKNLSESAGKWINGKTKHDKFSSNFFCFKRSLFLSELRVENIKMLWFHNSCSPNLHAWCVLWYLLNIMHWSVYIFQKYIPCERLLLILKRTCALNFCIRVFITQIHRFFIGGLNCTANFVVRRRIYAHNYFILIVLYFSFKSIKSFGC